MAIIPRVARRWFPFLRSKIERAEGLLLELPQTDCPVVNRFAPGVYLREIEMPAGIVVIGHEHTTEHFNVVLSGKARVLIDGKVQTITAGSVFKSGVGVRKVLHILETMRWMTVHPTEETDPDKLETVLIRKSDTFIRHHELHALADKPL